MTQTINQTFQDRYPGPYAYQPGRNGVDRTFDIYCQTTGDWIISSNYWEAETEAELVASVTTLALELSRPAPSAVLDSAVQLDLGAFQSTYPGHYVMREYIHDAKHAEIGVASSNGECLIIGFVSVPGDPVAMQEAEYVANALNQLFKLSSN